MVWDWIKVIKQHRTQVVDALLVNDVDMIRFHTLSLQSLLNLLYGRDAIDTNVFTEHYDFSERVLKSVA